VESNTVALSGELAVIEPVRHTPAGIPLVGFRLRHRSQQIEAGHRREVECELSGVAMGEAATAMLAMRQGANVTVEGFLNRKSRMSRELVLHVTKTRISS
jgi:primosomal replication protein N